MALLNGPRIVTSGLVLNLDAADRNSYVSGSTIWTDLSGNGNNGTLTNGPTFSSANGGAIVFDGVDDAIDNINQSISIQNNTPFTVDFVFKSLSALTSHFIGNWNVFVNPGWRVDMLSGQIRFIIISSGGSSGIVVVTNNTYNNNNIYNVCITYNGTNNANGVIIYINSLPVSTTTTLNTDSGTLINNKITLGASQLNTTSLGNYLNGSIYSSKLYNRALSAQEVAQNYNATKTRYGL